MKIPDFVEIHKGGSVLDRLDSWAGQRIARDVPLRDCHCAPCPPVPTAQPSLTRSLKTWAAPKHRFPALESRGVIRKLLVFVHQHSNAIRVGRQCDPGVFVHVSLGRGRAGIGTAVALEQRGTVGGNLHRAEQRMAAGRIGGGGDDRRGREIAGVEILGSKGMQR